MQSSVDVANELIKAALSFVSGSLVGGLLSHWLSVRRQRTDVAMKLMESYLNQYSAIADAKGLLASGRELTALEQNTIRKVGDWFELAGVLYLNGAASQKLLKRFGLIAEMKWFFRDATQHPMFSNSGAFWCNLKEVAEAE